MNGLDSGCGDGDCGSTHAAGAKGLKTTENIFFIPLIKYCYMGIILKLRANEVFLGDLLELLYH